LEKSHLRPLRLVAGLALLGAAFGAITLYALESNEVAVLRTRDAGGTLRETRVWLAEDDGALWVEAATPERPFYQDILARPEIEVVRGDESFPVTAVAEPGRAGHERIRALLAARYGWADAWVGLLQDTSRSIAVRLTPAARAAEVVRP
jgi:hypothetical protein